MLAQVSLAALISLALTQGVVAAFNPCGFAMLPAYLSYFLGLGDDDGKNTAANVVRGLVVGLTLTAGFVLFFGLIGLLTSTVLESGTIVKYIPYVTFAFGILMIPLGIAMLRGFEPKLNIPRLQKGGKTRDLPSIFMFGISYAAVSLSCTAPIFFGTVIGSFTREGIVDGTIVFLAYALGMGLVIMVLTLAMSMARNEVATFFRKALPYVNKVSGIFLIIAGVFLIFYGWWEIQVSRGILETNILVDESNKLGSTITNWVATVGGVRIAIAIGLILAAIMLWGLRSAMARGSWLVAAVSLTGLWLALEVFSARIQNVDQRFDLMIRGVINTVISVPERVGNWFTNPLRWQTLGELLFTIVVGGLVALRIRRRLRSSEATEATPPSAEPVSV